MSHTYDVGRYTKRSVRRRVFHDYLILYIVDNDTIRIVAIVHGPRDLTAFLKEA